MISTTFWKFLIYGAKLHVLTQKKWENARGEDHVCRQELVFMNDMGIYVISYIFDSNLKFHKKQIDGKINRQ